MKRILFAVLVALTLATVIFAQYGRPQFGASPFGGMNPPGQRLHSTGALEAALDLTDAQLEAINALNQTRQQRAQAIFSEIGQDRHSLNTLLDAVSPDAVSVGNAAIALRASENKLTAEREWILAELKKLLTGEQQQTLDGLLEANAKGPVLPMLGLGGPGRGQRGPRPH
jgi:Spy/CpxP family protein refolding chaperone